MHCVRLVGSDAVKREALVLLVKRMETISFWWLCSQGCLLPRQVQLRITSDKCLG